jgi:hypothetical protein
MHTLIITESDFLVRKIQYLGISIKGRPKLTAQGENKVTKNNTIDELIKRLKPTPSNYSYMSLF